MSFFKNHCSVSLQHEHFSPWKHVILSQWNKWIPIDLFSTSCFILFSSPKASKQAIKPRGLHVASLTWKIPNYSIGINIWASITWSGPCKRVAFRTAAESRRKPTGWSQEAWAPGHVPHLLCDLGMPVCKTGQWPSPYAPARSCRNPFLQPRKYVRSNRPFLGRDVQYEWKSLQQRLSRAWDTRWDVGDELLSALLSCSLDSNRWRRICSYVGVRCVFTFLKRGNSCSLGQWLATLLQYSSPFARSSLPTSPTCDRLGKWKQLGKM